MFIRCCCRRPVLAPEGASAVVAADRWNFGQACDIEGLQKTRILASVTRIAPAEKGTLGNISLKKTNQRLERSFCCMIPWPRLP